MPKSTGQLIGVGPDGKTGKVHSARATACGRAASTTEISAGNVKCSWFCGKTLTRLIVMPSTSRIWEHTVKVADDAGWPLMLALWPAAVLAQPVSPAHARAATAGRDANARAR